VITHLDLLGRTCVVDSLYGNASEGTPVAQTPCQAAPDCQSHLDHAAAHKVLQSSPVIQRKQPQRYHTIITL